MKHTPEQTSQRRVFIRAHKQKTVDKLINILVCMYYNNKKILILACM